ncbi:thermonuclease family protein [Lysinibacillus capsici]|uniref:thermonuclease family protein n=1 Tax=Lysinibacillus capsici TaxID=2115968 RepID=UPI002FDCB006
MKAIKWILLLFFSLVTLSLVGVSPIVWIGIILIVFGTYQKIQQNKGKVTFSRPGLIIAAGFAFSWITAIILTEPTTEVVEKEKDTVSIEKVAKDDNTKEILPVIAADNKPSSEEIKKQEQEKKKAEEEQQLIEKLSNLGLVTATVSRVVDGDTVELSDGNKVRLIGVNTPESTTRTETYGTEASDFTKSHLEGKQVYLQKDVSETDQYGRLLRLVWTDIPSDINNEIEIRSKMFNAKLVLDGYAEPSTYNPDVTYSEYFVTFASEARNQNKGLWAYGAEGTTKGDLDSPPTVTTTNNSSDTTNTTSTTSSGGGYEYYKNCTELRKVYPSGVGQDHPAYASKHDRDKDGWACER